MATLTGSNYYQKGVELAEAGKYQEGFNCIREHLQSMPQDVQALNDAGTILHCLGRAEDAVAYLIRARELQSDNPQVIRNLAEAYLGGGMAAEAAQLFPEMERMGLLDVELMNRAATRLLDQDRKGPAVEVLLQSRRLWPEQQVLTPMLEVIRSKRPKIAFVRNGQGEDGALADVCEFVEQRFKTEFCPGRDPQGMADVMRRHDIVWVDGGGEPAVEASRLATLGVGRCDATEGRTAKVIVSLRRSDVGDRWVRQVRWENVSIVVQIGSSAVEEALVQQVPNIRNRTRLAVVPNGINLSRYGLRRRERGKHLACLGCLTLEANPAFLIQCVQKLHYIDPGYKLFFSGAFENPGLEQYLRHMVRTLDLTSVVTFERNCGDLNSWLSDKHFTVASGIGEGQVESVLAGMACGLKPVIHNFPGAQRLFPQQYLFNIAEEFCAQVLSQDYQPEQYRRCVEERYPLDRQLKQVDGILAQLESEIEWRALAATGTGPAADSSVSNSVMPAESRVVGKP
ncbi:MAG: hypothetical protein ACM3VT_07560 [Solirubrobacterales bacterium]